jgi:tetratricopeptide (TPR) repeat protein
MDDSVNWQQVFSAVEQFCSKYPPDIVRVQQEVLRDLRREGLGIESKKFNQWVTNGILESKPQEARGYPIYDRIEIAKAYLAAYLFNIHGFRPQQIQVATQIYESDPTHGHPALHQRDVNPAGRARLILTGRILGVCGALVMEESTPPNDTVIICHEVPPPDSNHDLTIRERSLREVQELLKQEHILIGWSAEEPFDEVFAVMGDSRRIESRLRSHQFYAVPICMPKEDRCFEVVMGLLERSRLAEDWSERAQARKVRFTPESSCSKQIAHLLCYSLPNTIDLLGSIRRYLPHSRPDENSSLLSILVTAVLLRRPNRWIAAAFYGRGSNGTIYRRATSANYPGNYRSDYPIQERSNPFSWVHSHRTCLVVNRPVPDDFRLIESIYQPGVSHAFVPAIQLDDCTGVLHVIGEDGNLVAEPCFTHDDMGVLQVLARVVGEAYHRNLIASVNDICQTVPLPELTLSSERQLKATLARIIRDEVAPGTGHIGDARATERHLALFAIRVQQMRSRERQDTYFRVVRQRVFTYFKDHGADRQRDSNHDPAFRLNDDALVIVINDLEIGEVRRIREDLQQELEDISAINPDSHIRCAVWSVHISYDYIRTNFFGSRESTMLVTERDDSINRAVADIFAKTKDALGVIWQVRDADAALTKYNYQEAENILADALVLDRGNSYIWRHLAQARFGLGRYPEAEEAASRAIEIDTERGIRFASNHQRLAEAHFGQGHYDKAFGEMKKACECSRDLRYRRAYIQMLVLHGTPESLNTALALIIDTAAHVGADDPKNMAWLEYLRGEARLRSGEIDQARKSYEKAASLSPTYHDPDWDILRMVRQGEPWESGEEENKPC